jgi:hypothetical protein
VRLEERPRLEHMHVIGATGSGKTTFLKNILLQDFARGRGGVVFDPHGSHPDSLYHELLAALDEKGFTRSGRVHLIDPNVSSHVVPFNPLAPLPGTDFSVIADAMLQAFERAWDDENTHEKPTIRSVLKATFMALVELHMPLSDAKLLDDPHDRFGLRARVITRLDNEYARDELTRLHQTALDENAKRDFRAEVIGPINRLNEFVSSSALSAMLGQTEGTLDLLSIMERGDILLVNLQHGGAVSEADTKLLGAVLLRYLFLLAGRRQNREPFFLTIDECNRYLTGDVPNLLAESRKFGIGAILAHQFLGQLGKREEPLYQALLNSTEIKTVFRVKSPEEAQALAELVIPLDLETPVKALIKPAAVGQEMTHLRSAGRAQHAAESVTDSEGTGIAVSEGSASAVMRGSSHGTARALSDSVARGIHQAAAQATSTGEGASQLFSPDQGWVTLPELLSQGLTTSSGQSEMASSGLSSMASSGRSESETHADMQAESESTSHSVTHSRSRSRGRGRASGTTVSETLGEALRTVYAELPTAMHSKENLLYMAGELIRSLPVGEAFVAWRGRSARIRIPAPGERRRT